MPELPDAKRTRLIQQYSLSDHDAAVLLSESNAAEYFETVKRRAYFNLKSYSAIYDINSGKWGIIRFARGDLPSWL